MIISKLLLLFRGNQHTIGTSMICGCSEQHKNIDRIRCCVTNAKIAVGSVGIGAPRTQERFELWGVRTEPRRAPTNCSLPHDDAPACSNKGKDEPQMQQFTQVRSTLRCKTLLLLCGLIASRGRMSVCVQGGRTASGGSGWLEGSILL